MSTFKLQEKPPRSKARKERHYIKANLKHRWAYNCRIGRHYNCDSRACECPHHGKKT
jgi:hypothetical protein